MKQDILEVKLLANLLLTSYFRHHAIRGKLWKKNQICYINI